MFEVQIVVVELEPKCFIPHFDHTHVMPPIWIAFFVEDILVRLDGTNPKLIPAVAFIGSALTAFDFHGDIVEEFI